MVVFFSGAYIFHFRLTDTLNPKGENVKLNLKENTVLTR